MIYKDRGAFFMSSFSDAVRCRRGGAKGKNAERRYCLIDIFSVAKVNSPATVILMNGELSVL
ncbi:MAG: hypothetical protein IJ736_05620 [Firmicutes bacterium]|nr:hypothetical protein [Bacillota bacterium]